jgi:hypothetical protein
MTSRKKAVARLAREVGAGEKLIAKEKKDFKKTKTKLGKRNKKRALKLIKKAVEAMVDYKEEVKSGKAPPVASR